ncbi:MAG: AAA family ATPase [Planctomycetes bacterium]|nr:AAA family ATPase [Planctomycetota bacterium]
MNGWHWKGWKDRRPLYRLSDISANVLAPVLVLEGEKTADAAQQLFPNHVATTPMHGAKSPKKTDWSPIKGRTVYIWRDNDSAGQEFAVAVAALCTEAGAACVYGVEVPATFPDKWDVADSLPEGWDAAKLRGLLDGAAQISVATIFEPVTPEENPLQAITVNELMALELPERKMVTPWMREGGTVMVFGPRGVGKTYFILGLAISIANGSGFLRWEGSDPKGVLLIDGEMALTELRSRVSNLLPGRPAAPLRIISHELVYEKVERDLNFGVTDWQDYLSRLLDDHPDIRVVIFDNLSCLLPTVAEDQRDDWAQKVLPFLIALRRRGVATILIHHAGKGGQQRGTSAREDALTAVINLEKVPDADPTLGAQFVVNFTKCRDTYGDAVAPFEAQLSTDSEGLPTWSWKSVELSNEQRLLALVRDGVETVSEASEELGLSKGTVSKIKKRLISAGKLQPGQTLILAGE